MSHMFFVSIYVHNSVFRQVDIKREEVDQISASFHNRIVLELDLLLSCFFLLSYSYRSLDTLILFSDIQVHHLYFNKD